LENLFGCLGLLRRLRYIGFRHLHRRLHRLSHCFDDRRHGYFIQAQRRFAFAAIAAPQAPLATV
jgi:hypothetical protein